MSDGKDFAPHILLYRLLRLSNGTLNRSLGGKAIKLEVENSNLYDVKRDPKQDGIFLT